MNVQKTRARFTVNPYLCEAQMKILIPSSSDGFKLIGETFKLSKYLTTDTKNESTTIDKENFKSFFNSDRFHQLSDSNGEFKPIKDIFVKMNNDNKYKFVLSHTFATFHHNMIELTAQFIIPSVNKYKDVVKDFKY